MAKSLLRTQILTFQIKDSNIHTPEFQAQPQDESSTTPIRRKSEKRIITTS